MNSLDDLFWRLLRGANRAPVRWKDYWGHSYFLFSSHTGAFDFRQIVLNHTDDSSVNRCRVKLRRDGIVCEIDASSQHGGKWDTFAWRRRPSDEDLVALMLGVE